VVPHAAEAKLDRFLEQDRIVLEPAVADESLSRSGLAGVFVDIVGDALKQVGFRRAVQGPAVTNPKRILAADPAQVGGVFAFPVDVDVVAAAVAPAVDVVDEPQAVEEAEQAPRSIRVEQEIVLAITLCGHLAPPAGTEAH